MLMTPSICDAVRVDPPLYCMLATVNGRECNDLAYGM